MAGAFGVLIYTLRASHQYQAVVLADEMALVSHATAAEQPAR
ncbi:MAG TPA: hypothetical protein VHM31_18530 [Polyangia bacterium]|nr:hypothetical protein [Polyangia bacterium]